MIQRLQSIWMFIAAIVMALLYKLPMAKGLKGDTGMLLNGSLESLDHVALIVMNSVSLGLILLAIFLFKKRPVQLKINALNMLLILALPIIAYFLLRTDQGGEALVAIVPGTFFPAVAILFLILANRSIRKDDKLVKSADRLR